MFVSSSKNKRPTAGDVVWIVWHHHTWDAENNNTYFPVSRVVKSVDEVGIVRFTTGETLHYGKCYKTEAECRKHCLSPHMDE